MAKWYEHNDKYYDLEKVKKIYKYDNKNYSAYNGNEIYSIDYWVYLDKNILWFNTEQERDNEFDRIKKLLGIEE